MSPRLVIVVLLVVLLVALLPTWDRSRAWGFGPSGAMGGVLVVLLVMLVMNWV